MYPEDQLIMISALEHYSYCPRQCALIHLEQTFDENLYTLRGRRLHERVDQPQRDVEDGVRVERALPLWSDRLGLVGRADVVEFHDGVPYPIEYKHGKKRNWGHDDLQLCAQAVCLEEMIGCQVPRGAVFYHGSRRRKVVSFDDELRERVEQTVGAIRKLLAGSALPAAVNDARCTHCSLKQSCLPDVLDQPARARAVQRQLFAVLDD